MRIRTQTAVVRRAFLLPAIPVAATHLDVEVGDHVDRPDQPCGSLTAGTYGIVTARFS